MKRLLPLALFALLALALFAGLRHGGERALPSPLIGKAAPQFRAPLLGSAGTLAPADLTGRVWLLNVWASWCTSCGREHPLLMALASAGGAPVVGLNYKDQEQAAAGWLARHGNPYLYSVIDSDGRIGMDYGVYGVPETFVIDKRGIVRYRHVGVLTPEVMDGTIIPLLKELQDA